MPEVGLALHAERVALEEAGERSRGGTLFTTYEPCMSTGNGILMPCAELIIVYGISNVVYGVNDNNPDFRESGKIYLERHGVNVVDCSGLERTIKQGAKLNGSSDWGMNPNQAVRALRKSTRELVLEIYKPQISYFGEEGAISFNNSRRIVNKYIMVERIPD